MSYPFHCIFQFGSHALVACILTCTVPLNAHTGATDPADNKTSSLTISPTVAQHIHVCASHKKPRLLLKYIATVREQEKAAKVRQAGPMIIFCNKIKTLKFVHDFLKRQNVKVSMLWVYKVWLLCTLSCSGVV
jgi:hypothetical protein